MILAVLHAKHNWTAEQIGEMSLPVIRNALLDGKTEPDRQRPSKAQARTVLKEFKAGKWTF